MVRHLTLLPTEPTAPIATSYDLLCWSRLGSAYDPDELETAVEDQRLVHYLGFYRLVEDLPLHRAEAPYWPGRGELKPWVHEVADWFAANEECRQDILATLRAEGPLPATQLPDTCQRTWGSTGWTNNKNVQQMLWYMLQRDEVAVASSTGREKLWDLAERVYGDAPLPDPDEALAERDRRRLRSMGIARPTGPVDRAEPTYVRRRRRAGRGRGRAREVAGRPDVPRGPRRLRGPRGVAVAVRPAGDGPQAARRALRVRLRPGDVQAEGPADLGLLRAADPVRRPAGREARRHGRAGRGRAPRRRRARGRAVHDRRWPRPWTPRSRTWRRGWAWRSSASVPAGRGGASAPSETR